MSQVSVEKKAPLPKDKKYRWDFADMILGGKDCGSTVFKHLHPQSDIKDHKTDILLKIWEDCVATAFNSNFTETEYGPSGQVAIHDFSYEYRDEETKTVVRFRVCVQESTRGVYFCMRRINGIIPPLLDQGYSPETRQKLLRMNRRGLVLFGGEMGTGKTSGASSTIVEFLKANGGSAITLEDPPEYNLHGAHIGENRLGGFCIQRAASAEEMSKEIPTLMRASAPEIIFLGEIRDPAVAQQVILAASNGHLIYSTIHGKGIVGCLNRIISLAASAGSMSIEDAAKLLADSLSMVIYQELLRKKSTGTKTLRYWEADLDGEKGQAIRNKIRTQAMEQLPSDIGDFIQNASKI